MSQNWKPCFGEAAFAIRGVSASAYRNEAAARRGASGSRTARTFFGDFAGSVCKISGSPPSDLKTVTRCASVCCASVRLTVPI